MRIAVGDLRQGWDSDAAASTPASFTRFVQPFAYNPAKREAPSMPFRYERIKDIRDRAERENYLTVETADALFRRALWLRLKPVERQWMWRHTMRFGGRDLDVCMHAPELILFEWNRDSRNIRSEPRGDLLRIGLLILDLYFPDKQPREEHLPQMEDLAHPDLQDLLRLNEIFRYWRRPYPEHSDLEKLLAKCPISFLQDEPIGSLEDSGDVAEKLYFQRWHDFLKLPLRIDDEDWHLFPSSDIDWGDIPPHWTKRPGYPEFFYADDKAFVWTCAVLKSSEPRLAKESGAWAKLLNIDLPGADLDSCTDFEKEWVRDKTYTRWAESGCLYGFNYHSGALAVPESSPIPAWDHFATMYFDIAMMLLYVRLASFRFSARLYRISTEARERRSENRRHGWRKSFDDLRRSFSWFTNLYQFPLISNKQQAIEMYALMRRAMDVQALFEEIQSEVHNSHEYVLQSESSEQTRLANTLNIVAMTGLTFALAVGFLGMNVFLKDGAFSAAAMSSEFTPWLLLAVISVAAGAAIVLFWTSAEGLARLLDEKKKLLRRIALLVLLAFLAALFHDFIRTNLQCAWIWLRNLFR